MLVTRQFSQSKRTAQKLRIAHLIEFPAKPQGARYFHLEKQSKTTQSSGFHSSVDKIFSILDPTSTSLVLILTIN